MIKKASVQKTLGKLYEGEGWNTVEPSGLEKSPYDDSPVVKDCGPVPTAQATEKPSFSNLANAMVDIPGAIQNGGDAVAKVHSDRGDGCGDGDGDGECEKPISDIISASLTFEAPDMPPTEVGMADERDLEPLPEPEEEISPEPSFDSESEEEVDPEFSSMDDEGDDFPVEDDFPEEGEEEEEVEVEDDEIIEETPEEDSFEDLPDDGEGEEKAPDSPVSDELENALKSESDKESDEPSEEDKDKD